MHLPRHLAATALALGLSGAPPMLFAADGQPEDMVEDVVERQASESDGDERPGDADVGEASYNIENCAQPSETPGEEVESEDLDEECEPVVR